MNKKDYETTGVPEIWAKNNTILREDELWLKDVLTILFIDNEIDYELMEQVILKYAYEQGYLDYNEKDNMYYLSKKGIDLLGE